MAEDYDRGRCSVYSTTRRIALQRATRCLTRNGNALRNGEAGDHDHRGLSAYKKVGCEGLQHCVQQCSAVWSQANLSGNLRAVDP